MDKLNALIDRARVILTSVVTIIGAVTVALSTIVIPAAASAYGVDSGVVVVLGQVVVLLTGAAAVIRRVTPVAKEQRGLL